VDTDVFHHHVGLVTTITSRTTVESQSCWNRIYTVSTKKSNPLDNVR